MKHPRWGDIRRFCEVDGWTPTLGNRQRKRRDHDRYKKVLPDGRVLRTKASHGNDEIGDRNLVTRILRHQLEVTPEEFWEAVDNGTPPARSQVPQPSEGGPPVHQLPDWLAVNLAMLVKLPDSQIAELSEDEAMKIWGDWCASPT